MRTTTRSSHDRGGVVCGNHDACWRWLTSISAWSRVVHLWNVLNQLYIFSFKLADHFIPFLVVRDSMPTISILTSRHPHEIIPRLVGGASISSDPSGYGCCRDSNACFSILSESIRSMCPSHLRRRTLSSRTRSTLGCTRSSRIDLPMMIDKHLALKPPTIDRTFLVRHQTSWQWQSVESTPLWYNWS